MSKKDLWVLEDDKECHFIYEEVLGIRHSLKIFSSIAEFHEELCNEKAKKPDLFLADLRLGDGFFLDYLANKETNQKIKFPFIVISSLDDIDILRTSFKEGAADYLLKPFKKTELIAKTEKALEEHNLGFGRVKKWIVPDDLKEILTAKERSILSLFLRSRTRKVSKMEILEEVWQDVHVDSKTLDVHLYNLRKKLTPYGIRIKHHGNQAWHLFHVNSDSSTPAAAINATPVAAN